MKQEEKCITTTNSSETGAMSKILVQAEIHAAMQPPKPEVPIESQVLDEALDQVGHLPTPKDPLKRNQWYLNLLRKMVNLWYQNHNSYP